MRQTQQENSTITNIHRISHSFPPDYQLNNKYFAKVHSIFQKVDIKVDVQKIYYRPIYSLQELEEVKRLHREWFPPDYPDEFYTELFRSQFYRSLLAVYDVQYKNKKINIILGLLTYEYKNLDYSHVRFSFSDLCHDKSCLYILTFGVINEVRNKGIASCLIRELLKIAKKDPLIKYISLDVVWYNEQARRCYEKNGFIFLETQKNYYEIFGKEYDACVYCYYLNGAKRPRKTKEVVGNIFNGFQRFVTCNKVCKKKSKRKDSDDNQEEKNQI